MKTLLDFIPILLFFAAYKLHAWFGVGKDEAIYFATPVLMAATVVQMAIIYWIDRKLTALQKITLGMILVFGGITLALHDKRFIMWKPTVLYAGMAIALAVAIWGMKNNFLKSMLGSQLELPDSVWHKLNVAWVFYTAFMAISNGYVAMYYSEDAWANFKLWGYVFPLVFLIGQGLYIAPHLKNDEPSEDSPSP
ncbi:septation protein A [Rhodoferax saidenbachensis]|uniref:Inner membrane-spanning protein YciB n=1 Tax=Rhodoferax saidenbachensis TaxID=1484693 RepID=A0ABU1ZIP4_9BURK|nr:septation protein A [Rhodoferax saidenbachensis]MDR7305238.1 intracellular septation protein [Rhodoferax saidenbachensis]